MRFHVYPNERCASCKQHSQLVYNKRNGKLLCDECHAIALTQFPQWQQLSRSQLERLATALHIALVADTNAAANATEDEDED